MAVRSTKRTLTPEEVAQRMWEKEALRKQQQAIQQRLINKALIGVYCFIGLFGVLVAYCFITFWSLNH